MPAERTRDCLFLTGPTASGKTRLAIELARRLDGEILSLDSMALYRRLDIGTAKPTLAERVEAPHHLIDRIEPSEDYSLAQYVAAAEQVVDEVQARGKRPIFAGGTPLYLKALLRGIFAGPPADWEFRRRLEAETARHVPGWLHEQVARVDPVSAAKLHPNDTRRLIRALEVLERCGQPISQLQRQFEQARSADEARVFVLDWPRESLYRRIDERVEAMFAAGLVAETASLQAAGIQLGRTARQAVGYREVLEHLAGERDLPATIERVKFQTHQFARRQLTWFRSLGECRWIERWEGDDPAAIVNTIASAVAAP